MSNTYHQAISTPLGMSGGVLHQLPDGRAFVSYPRPIADPESFANYKFGLSDEVRDEIQQWMDDFKAGKPLKDESR